MKSHSHHLSVSAAGPSGVMMDSESLKGKHKRSQIVNTEKMENLMPTSYLYLGPENLWFEAKVE